jgi:hypothetical protein
MNASTLIGNKVTEVEIAQVPEVPFTNTFHPVHHRDVINAVRDGINLSGLDIVRSEYALAREGMQMFAVWDLNTGNDDLCWSLGIRNSMNKSLALGITAGTRVFICDNLAFDGEFVEFRRHTKGLDQDELEFLAYRSVRKMIGRLTKFQAWHEGLKKYELSEADAKILLVEIMTNSVFPASKFTRFNELYFGGVYDPTLWGLHEAATDTLKGSSLLSLPKKNKALNNILNKHIESIYADSPSPLGDFYEQRALNQH